MLRLDSVELVILFAAEKAKGQPVWADPLFIHITNRIRLVGAGKEAVVAPDCKNFVDFRSPQDS